MRAAALGIVLAANAAAFAGEDRPDVDCGSPNGKFAETICMGNERKAADAALNVAYAKAMEGAARFDERRGWGPPAVDGLRTAQRAWIAFRDATCAVEIAPATIGGSYLIRSELACLTRHTRRRTQDLVDLTENLR